MLLYTENKTIAQPELRHYTNSKYRHDKSSEDVSMAHTREHYISAAKINHFEWFHLIFITVLTPNNLVLA